MNRAELAIMIRPEHRGYVFARTARQACACVCKADALSWTVRATYALPGLQARTNRITHRDARRPDQAQAEGLADSLRLGYPDATVTVAPVVNPNHRPNCLGEIPAGTAYLEYLGEAAAWQFGSRYCQRCGIAVWGRPARDADRLAEAAMEVIDRAVAEGRLPG